MTDELLNKRDVVVSGVVIGSVRTDRGIAVGCGQVAAMRRRMVADSWSTAMMTIRTMHT